MKESDAAEAAAEEEEDDEMMKRTTLSYQDSAVRVRTGSSEDSPPLGSRCILVLEFIQQAKRGLWPPPRAGLEKGCGPKMGPPF